MNSRKAFIKMINDKKKLTELLNVSKQHIDLCERYGCSGLWTKKEIIGLNKNVDLDSVGIKTKPC